MEQPVSLAADDVRDEKVKLLRCVAPPRLEDVVLGQYTASGSEPEGYTDDPGVPADSKTPTFASVALFIDNERWAGVPFIIKAGKALNERVVVVRFQFKSPPRPLLANASEVASALAAEVRTQEGRTSSGLAAAAAAKPQQQGALPPAAADRLRNELVLRLQPDEAIYMKLVVKKPGLDPTPVISELDLDYNRRYTVRTSFLGGGRFLGFSSERATERERRRESENEDEADAEKKKMLILSSSFSPPSFFKNPEKTNATSNPKGAYIPDAYERLLLDAVRGDQQHFVRRDELRAAWALFDPLLAATDAGELPVHKYPAGSRGPKEADELAARHGYVRNAGYEWPAPGSSE